MDQEILKFPAQSSSRVTEKINVRDFGLGLGPNPKPKPKPNTNLNLNVNLNLGPGPGPGPNEEKMIDHIDSPNNNTNNGNSSSKATDQTQPNGHGQKLNFFTLPLMNANNTNTNMDDNTIINIDQLNEDGTLTQKKSFPDDLSPSNLKSPKSQNNSTRHDHHTDLSDVGHNGYDDDIKRPMKIIIVCYKLPLKCSYNKESSEWEFEWEDIRNVLANLRVLQSSHPNEYIVNFVGWPGISSTAEERDNLEDQLYLLKYPCYPVFLSESQIRDCYKIYCRSYYGHYFII